MKDLSDHHLIESYFDAIEMQLEEEFIQLLYEEIKIRNLHLEPYPLKQYPANIATRTTLSYL